MGDLTAGATVEVTNLDGETAAGEVVMVHATTASEYDASALFDSAEGTLYDYWNRMVDPDAPVVTVDLGGGQYDYPADKVEVTA